VPGLDGYLTRVATERVAGGLACPGEPAPSARIKLTGGRLLPQVLHGRLSKIELSLPDATIGGVRHAAFTATLRDVSQPRPGTTHVGGMDASITIGFASMPSPPDGPPPAYGVRYLSASVDAAGIKVAVGGVTVEPFSVLPATVDGRATTYGAEDGLLTATATGAPENGPPAPIMLSTRPTIVGNTLDLTPHEIRMFGLPFPAKDVLAEVKTSATTYPLQPLPAHLAYRGVEVLPQGLRISLSGRDIDFGKGMLAGTGCHP
jgi:hypothetical protein